MLKIGALEKPVLRGVGYVYVPRLYLTDGTFIEGLVEQTHAKAFKKLQQLAEKHKGEIEHGEIVKVVFKYYIGRFTRRTETVVETFSEHELVK